MTRTSHKKIIVISLFVALCMFLFSFAISPLYSAVCKYTNFNTAKRVNTLSPDFGHRVMIQFVTTNNENLPWEFYPKTPELSVPLEQNNKVFFHAKNLSNKTMTVQAIPSFSPAEAAKDFQKIECFCFRQQTLKPGESINMPVMFRIAKTLPKDIRTITLSYTLFDMATKRTSL